MSQYHEAILNYLPNTDIGLGVIRHFKYYDHEVRLMHHKARNCIEQASATGRYKSHVQIVMLNDVFLPNIKTKKIAWLSRHSFAITYSFARRDFSSSISNCFIFFWRFISPASKLMMPIMSCIFNQASGDIFVVELASIFTAPNGPFEINRRYLEFIGIARLFSLERCNDILIRTLRNGSLPTVTYAAIAKTKHY